MQIVILCGGEGKRIKKLFPKKPKGLIEINKKPFMELIFESLIKNGMKDIVMCTGIGHKDYFSYFGNKFNGLNISYSKDPKNQSLGTGGAILNASDLLNDIFFVQYGDTLLDINYKLVLDSHINSKKNMTMTVLPISKSEEKPNVFFDSKEGLVKYAKGSNSESFQYIDYGLLLFNKSEILKYRSLINKNLDLGFIQSDLCESNNCNLFFANKKYLEIGTPKSYYCTKNKLTSL